MPKKTWFKHGTFGRVDNKIGEGEKDEMTSTEQSEDVVNWSGKWGWREDIKYSEMNDLYFLIWSWFMAETR